MNEQGWLTERFEENRPRLRGVAYRILGSLSEAEDAVQEAGLRLNGVLAVLDPDAVIRIDGAARMAGGAADAANEAREVRGATWAKQLIAMARGVQFVQPALINGSVGLIVAPRGKLSRAVTFTFTDARVTRVEVTGDPARLRELDIALL